MVSFVKVRTRGQRENARLQDIGASIHKKKKRRNRLSKKRRRAQRGQKRAKRLAQRIVDGDVIEKGPAYRAAVSQLRVEYRFGNYWNYLKTGHWKKRSDLARVNAGQMCSRCKSPEFLQVHHANYDRLFEEKATDLEVLCRWCHEDEHQLLPTDEISKLFRRMFADT